MSKRAGAEGKVNIRINPITIISLLIIAEVLIYFMASTDTGSMPALRWLIAVTFIAVLLRPYLPVNSGVLWDNGFCLSFSIGFAFSFLLAWFLSACNICSFNTIICFVSVAVLAICCYPIPGFKKISEYKWDFEKVERFIWGFALFALFFQFAFWVIGFNGALDSGTENYMDFGFMQSIFRQETVAPYDLWFANEKLNYYYLGQAASVFLCRLAITTPEYGYNLMLCTFWSVVFAATGEIVYWVVRSVSGETEGYEKYGKIAAAIAAVVGSIYNAFAANGQWLVYGIFTKIFNIDSNTPDGGYTYWFPEATVYIRTELGDADNGKNEFPSYSAILGDLHAHVINVIFVVALVALVFDYIFSKKEEKKSYVNLIAIGILLGLFKGTNYWDFIIYYVITGAVVVFCDFTEKGINKKSVLGVAIKAAIVTALSFVVTLPFTLTFKKMASEICIADVHSPLYKLIILWGIPIVITVVFLIWLINKKKDIAVSNKIKAGILAFGLCVIGLIVTPEVLYIKDIYGDENARFNTMFKLTYQAFILFGIIIAVSVGVYIFNGLVKKKTTGKLSSGLIGAGVIVFFSVLLSMYTKQAISDWMGDITEGSGRNGISTLEPLYWDYFYQEEMLAADIINQDDKKVINIVEAEADSYTHGAALSVITGTCTPVGWFVHEWMWRDDSDIVAQRESEVRMFYELGDIDYNKSFLEKYNIDYIFIGPREYEKYYVNYLGFENLGDILWEENSESMGDMKLIKVKRNP